MGYNDLILAIESAPHKHVTTHRVHTSPRLAPLRPLCLQPSAMTHMQHS